MKILALIQALLIGFLRDKKSILLLFLLPFLLIGSIFGSFNSEGLQQVPVGITGSLSADERVLLDEYFTQVSITEFSSQEQCEHHLRKHQIYACLVLNTPSPLVHTMIYDNTREPVIWEVVETINRGFGLIRLQESLKRTQGLLEQLSNLESSTKTYQKGLDQTSSVVSNYQRSLRDANQELAQTQRELNQALNQLDRTLQDADNEHDDMREELNNQEIEVTDQLNNLYVALFVLENSMNGSNSYTQEVRNELNAVQNEIDDYFDTNNDRLDTLQEHIQEGTILSAQGERKVDEIERAQQELYEAEGDLDDYANQIRDTKRDLDENGDTLNEISNQDANTLLQPFDLLTLPAYIPEYTGEETEEITVSQGISLISFQTLYPTVLLLIIVFLSMLTSAFLTLNLINGSAMKRLKIIPNIAISEVLAIFISSHIILIPPLLLIIFLGEFLLNIPLFQVIFLLSNVFFLVASIFIIIGMTLAYLIRKESTTLIIASFLLVFIIFISGVLLPIERMNPFVSAIANITPGRVFTLLTSRILFHKTFAQPEILMLLWWIVSGSIFLIGARAYYGWRTKREG